MTVTSPVTTVTPDAVGGTEVGVPVAADEQLVAEELLVEDVSIDGMCGVY